VKSERPAPRSWRRVGGDQRVARGTAHTFAEPVDTSSDKHDGPDNGDCNEYLAQRGKAVAEPDQRAAPVPIG
jgi:hypothetical protein